ncbi:TPR-like protein [Wolfiporia cocos MD-104 SS10]|uniref:TPR-like protein n=1 Tax=Wolfiporia cocos (strain MD-104) TaxID=742152 RepID=A0A2H3J2P5_WOLCO|nr:TPR-like protein [Wolfiporia cocos MD-104 SS10]
MTIRKKSAGRFPLRLLLKLNRLANFDCVPWELKLHPPERYTIRNVKYDRYVSASFSAKCGSPCQSSKREEWWRVMKIDSRRHGPDVYSIVRLRTDLCWVLSDEENDTPIELGTATRNSPHALWKIVSVLDEEKVRGQTGSTNRSFRESASHSSPNDAKADDTLHLHATPRQSRSVDASSASTARVDEERPKVDNLSDNDGRPKPKRLQTSDACEVHSEWSDADKAKEEGDVAFKAQLLHKAIELYSKAVDMRPSEPTFLISRATAHLRLRQYRRALADCQRASSLQSNSPSETTLITLARCEFFTASTASALFTLRRIIEFHKSHAVALKLQKAVLEVSSHLRDYESAKQRGDWNAATSALDRSTAIVNEEAGEIPAEWLLKQVELEMARGNWDSAMTAAREILEANQDLPDAWTLQGLMFFLTDDTPKAMQHARSAMDLDPGHGGAQRLRNRIQDVERLRDAGNVKFNNGRLQEAIDDFGEALKCVGTKIDERKGGVIRAHLLLSRAKAFFRADEKSAALADIKELLQLDSTIDEARQMQLQLEVDCEGIVRKHMIRADTARKQMISKRDAETLSRTAEPSLGAHTWRKFVDTGKPIVDHKDTPSQNTASPEQGHLIDQANQRGPYFEQVRTTATYEG